jgi:signal transduction histidine kinase
LLTVSMPRPVHRLVPAEVGEHVEAVVREAVSNVISHAHASELSLEVDTNEEVLTVSVQDNGIGFPSGAVRAGLNQLGQRAAGLGGAPMIARLPAGGTRLTWRVPLPRLDEG